jgi:hypothetical protein
MLRRVVLALIISLYMPFCFASGYKNEFAFVNKTYDKDLTRSLNLYETWEQYYEGTSPFYVVMPKKDFHEFQSAFNKSLEDHKIKQLPNLVTDEQVLKDCGEDVNKVMSIGGWEEQQVIKMCFSQTKIAGQYLTLDSDMYFKKSFNNSRFYTESGELKMWLHKASALGGGAFSSEAPLYQASIDISKLLKVRNSYQYFVLGYATWDSRILTNLLSYSSKLDTCIDKFSKMIKKVPYEMQWYGMYVNEFYPGNMNIIDLNAVHNYGRYPCVKYRINKHYFKIHDESIAILLNSKDGFDDAHSIEDYCRFRLIG